MKKNYLRIFIGALLVGAMSFSGCLLDALNTLTQNIPISVEFTINNSSESSIQKTETVDLSNSTTYKEYSDKIQNINYVQAEFRDKTVSPSNLSANVMMTLSDNNGNVLFTYPLGTITPADYQNTPFQLNLSSDQISLINAYLSTLSNKKFIATISFNNVSPTPYSIDGTIDIVFQMKAKTN
jgi:hypothetical protein